MAYSLRIHAHDLHRDRPLRSVLELLRSFGRQVKELGAHSLLGRFGR